MDSSSFPLLHSGRVFHKLVCLLTVVRLHTFFNFTKLFSYRVFFCLFHAPLDVVVHFLVFLRSCRFESFLPQFSPFCRTDQEFLQWPRVFFFGRRLPRISLAVSITAVLKVVITESMSVSSLLMMVRGANFPPIVDWKGSTHWGLSAFWCQTWVLYLLACWFFSGEGGRSSSASRGHFQCLLLENLMFWQCLLLIGSASSLECNQSGCGAVHIGYARSIFWMLCDDQKCLQTQDR